MREVLLFTTLGCHLCEEAAAQLRILQGDFELAVHEVEIADGERLLQAYGVRIPVVNISDHELDWPFNLEELRAFLAAAD